MTRVFLSRLAAAAAALALLGASPAPAPAAHGARAVFAGGCFWGVAAVLERLRGVTGVVSGFSGGAAPTAHYALVSTGTTGHAESVEVTYDPARISYEQLLAVFFTVAHDPTELNRQGPDEGPQYRSAIFYADESQRRAATAAIAKLSAAHAFGAPIVTQVVPLRGFYAAESYHQHYFDQHPDEPYIVTNDAPKVRALREKFPKLVSG